MQKGLSPRLGVGGGCEVGGGLALPGDLALLGFDSAVVVPLVWRN